MHGAEQFIDSNFIMYFKLLLAMILGGVIGTERALLARQAAGTRTFGLVALGACLFIIISNNVSSAYLGVVNFDPTHIAAGIITGIGFIGGGLIIFRRDALHGTTTAAGLWIAAGLGIAVGYGMYGVALFTELLTLLMFTGVWYMENGFKRRLQRITTEDAEPLASKTQGRNADPEFDAPSSSDMQNTMPREKDDIPEWYTGEREHVLQTKPESELELRREELSFEQIQDRSL